MKKYIYLFLLMVGLATTAYSQAIHIFHDNQPKGDVYLNAEVDSIRIKPIAGEPGKYEYLLYTTTGEVAYDMEKVDSIKFNLPHFKLLPHKGKCQIPNEIRFEVVNMIYSDSETSPIIRMPDGKEFKGEIISSSDGCYLHRINIPVDDDFVEKLFGRSEEIWYAVDGERRDSLNIEFTGKPVFQNRWTQIGVSSEANSYKLQPLMDNLRLEITDTQRQWAEGEYDWANWEYDSEGDILINFEENESSEKRELVVTPLTDYLSCWISGYIVQVAKFKHSAEEHMNALKDFYDLTGMKDLDTNWFSDEPLWKWDFYINNNAWDNFYWHINDHMVTISTGGGQYTGITGPLPPSFEVFIDDMDDTYGYGGLDLTQCALYGPIPENIKKNPRWNEGGWGIIPQLVWYGGGFDFEGNSNLFLNNVEIENFISGETTNVYDVLSKNRLTWVFNSGAVDMIGGISDERVNKYLDYKDKGFGLVVTVGGYWDTPYDNYRDYVVHEQEVNGLSKEILWTKGFDKADIGSYGSMSLVNDKGELIWYRQADGGMPESYYLDQIDEICRQYFGEPSEHPIYSAQTYKSTDFSRDGEVMVLQQATVGKGIDLVLTGDQFIDTDMEEGGVFETQVNEAMENFFSVEPYTSMRDRFNVYAVKAVSINDYRGSDHVFNNDDSKVLEYVGKIPDIDMDNVTVAVLRYDPNYSFFVSGYASLLENGASIAYLEQGNASEVIVHEAGGHGFGKLIDEYIFDEAVDNRVSDEDLEGFKEFIKGYYHDRGWGMNVSTTDVAEEVPWSKFLKDSRYEGEVGIYKGAWLYPYNLWRASENSVMKETYNLEFNAPSREAIYKRIMQLSEGEGWTYDYEAFVAFDQQTQQRKNRISANSSDTKKQVIHKMPKVKRFVDGQLEEIPTPFFKAKDNVMPESSKEIRKKKLETHSCTSSSKKIVDNCHKRDRVMIKGGQVVTCE